MLRIWVLTRCTWWRKLAIWLALFGEKPEGGVNDTPGAMLRICEFMRWSCALWGALCQLNPGQGLM